LIILDTSALIDLFRGGNEIRKMVDGDVASTAISYHEIYVGIKHNKAKAEERFFTRFFSDTKILDLDRASAEKSSGEIDFVIQHKGAVVPIEVKAAENLQGKSLKAFSEKFGSKRAIRFSLANYREESWMTNIPLYAAAGLRMILDK